MLWLSNLVVDVFRQGVPFVATAVGAAYGLQRGKGQSMASSLGWLALFSGGGWLVGHLTSKAALRLMEGSPAELPQAPSRPLEEPSSGTLSPLNNSLAGIAEPPSQPAGSVSVLPAQPRANRQAPQATMNGEVISIYGGPVDSSSMGKAYGA